MDNNNLISGVLDNLTKEIQDIVSKSRHKILQNINIDLLKTYWQIGKLICDKETEAEIRDNSSRKLILELSKELTQSLGKGFSRSNLFNMRKFYLLNNDVQTLSGHLSWSKYCELNSIPEEPKRLFYKEECINSNWSVRELKRQINSSLYERLILSQGKENKDIVMTLAKGNLLNKPDSIIKDPYVFEFLGIPENKPILERDLEKKLIKHIEAFLLELGRGFMYLGSQYRITINNTHYYADMVFYNKILHSYVLIELKTKKLQISDGGQMNTYLNYFKTEINDEYDNPPIGIIICADKDDIAAEYILGGLSNQVFASKYTLVLPNRDLIIHQVEDIISK